MSEENPWTTVSTRRVYENAWLTVREDQVIRPDGQPGIYGVVSPRETATGVVALTDDRQVVLVGQFRYTLGIYSWELPEGGAKSHETVLEAAKRELREETGLVAERWSQLGGELHISNSLTDETGFVFLAEGLEQGEASPEGTEQLAVKRVPFGEALRQIDSGEINDAVTVIGLLRAARKLGL